LAFAYVDIVNKNIKVELIINFDMFFFPFL